MIRNKDLVFVRLNDTNAQQKLFGYEHTHTQTQKEKMLWITHTHTRTHAHTNMESVKLTHIYTEMEPQVKYTNKHSVNTFH